MSVAFHYKYPFLFHGEEALTNILKDVPTEEIKNIVASIVEKEAWNRVSDDPLEIMLLIAILQRLKARRLLSRYAVNLSKKISSELQRENVATILDVARRVIDEKIHVENLQLGGVKASLFKVPIPTYLKVSQSFKSPKWKLVNQIVISGHVYLGGRDLIRLIEETLKESIANERICLRLPENLDLTEEYNRISNIEKSFVERVKVPKGKIVVEAFPPCMKELLSRAYSGESLSHTERFSLATFLFALGMSIDEVNEIFSNLPDYDARKTLYQLRHLKGMVGSGTKYSPPSCKKLQFYGICTKRTEKCKDIVHPLQYYLKNVRKKRRKEQGEHSEAIV